MKERTVLRTIVASLGLAASLVVSAGSPNTPQAPAAGMDVPLVNWGVDTRSFLADLKAQRRTQAKSATDIATVFRPVTPCRLIDTRGFPAAIGIVGARTPNSTTNVNSSGFCGIPSGEPVAGISVSFTIDNQTPNNGGYIALLQQGAPVNGINAVFNIGQEWTAGTANIPIPNDSGNFEIYIAGVSTVHVIIDVNGYFQDLNDVDVGSQELDFWGNTPGDQFEVTNLGAGSAISAYSGSGAALTIKNGSLRALGAGVGTNTFATIHQVNAGAAFGFGGTLCGASFPSYSVIDNTYANNDPNAMVFITPRSQNGVPNASYEAYYYVSGGCASTAANGHWIVHRLDGAALATGQQFSVLIVKP